MKTTFLMLLLAAATLRAQVPAQPEPGRYARLSSDSPFTSKPLAPEVEARADVFENWALGGVTKLKDGYYTILIDKKDPTKRGVVGKGELKGFTVEGVTYGEDGWRGTKVRIRSGSDVATLEFDDKLVAVKAQAQPNPGNPQARPGQAGQPGQPAAGQPGARTPRPRVVVPSVQNPNPGAATQGQRPNPVQRQRGGGR